MKSLASSRHLPDEKHVNLSSLNSGVYREYEEQKFEVNHVTEVITTAASANQKSENQLAASTKSNGAQELEQAARCLHDYRAKVSYF